MQVGDKVKIRSGKQIWTITEIVFKHGNTILCLENPKGTSHRLSYLEDAKLVED